MLYEAVLLIGVIFAVGYALLVSMQWSYPLSSGARAIVQAVLFIAIGIYFVVCWTRTGQTLAAKAWRLRVIGKDGRPLPAARAVLRYLLAWHLWLPGLAIAALMQLRTGSALAVVALSFALLMLPALFDSDRRLLHDRWSGTRVVRVPS